MSELLVEINSLLGTDNSRQYTPDLSIYRLDGSVDGDFMVFPTKVCCVPGPIETV